ncbi:4-diphosphocytidyl-2-C-methyl-D-erythritol kinase [Chitinophaga skermanii]|uniref:4-diphosphocytidyl-2-C-methyl-D-erythritol kinase n=1 Tax=Chitinophaga skermanii TaxID=331697 RepID=A0A327QT18_9BACT|nr:4-(cytidine 5'-diphospho)-2-C-methyl-D-erythritol kinase [Chitinophaga skermanii]RAJ06995.1 4-diphosphocytidyl-2-C-methyl-D-erythritol kinase [Chitinophaga skermanii]
MVVFPNCKINLGLHILGKRPDGFHDLETVFYPVPLLDVLEIITAKEMKFTMSGIAIPGADGDNLCLQAYRLLKADYPSLPPVHMHLHKNIPTGAGLGGGSSDAAFTLMLLNDKYKLGISKEQLLVYAAQLGSDCAFFIENKPSIAYGRGEILEPIEVDLSEYDMWIVHPGVHVNTGWAFKQLHIKAPENSLKAINWSNVQEYRNVVSNDFEEVVFKEHPLIGKIKEEMYANGAVYASMSGSGSAVLGLFPKGMQINIAGIWSETGYRVFKIK